MAKGGNDTILLLLLAAGGVGYYFWKKQQTQQPAQSPPFVNPNALPSVNPVADAQPGANGIFENIDGVESNVDTAEREFETLVQEGFVNANAEALGLTPYEKDVIYRDMHPAIFANNPKQDSEANRIWAKYPGLKV